MFLGSLLTNFQIIVIFNDKNRKKFTLKNALERSCKKNNPLISTSAPLFNKLNR